MGALSVLVEISSNLDIRKHITDLGAVPLLVNLLSDPARSVVNKYPCFDESRGVRGFLEQVALKLKLMT